MRDMRTTLPFELFEEREGTREKWDRHAAYAYFSDSLYGWVTFNRMNSLVPVSATWI
jgi:hypothetical protein